MWSKILILVLCTCSCTCTTYSNLFCVEVTHTFTGVIDQIAEKHGFVNLGQVGSLEGIYLFQHNGIAKQSRDPSNYISEKLMQEPGVTLVEQQTRMPYSKRVQQPQWNLASVEKEEMESVNQQLRQSPEHAEKSKKEVDQRLNDLQAEPLI